MWEIFDRWGNKIGEVRPEPSGGNGCAGVLVAVLLLIASVIVWPIMVKLLITLPGEEAVWGWVQIVAILIDLVVHAVILIHKEEYSFLESWGKLILSITFFASVLLLLTAAIFDEVTFGGVLGLVFLNLCMSIGAGLAGSITIAIVRWFRFRKLSADSANEYTEK